MEGGVLWRNGCDGKALRCGAGERHQHGHDLNQFTRFYLYLNM